MTEDEVLSSEGRVVVWFSCGAASAAAARIVMDTVPADRVEIVYCDTMSTEHPDNQRFFNDVQEWLDHPIKRITSEKYQDINEVFSETRYMAGVAGARCTVEMKKKPRFEYERADDIHVFGFSADEEYRVDRFEENNPELHLWWVLRDRGIEKQDCLDLVERAGVNLPTMYVLGYKNNNCLGCVKATSANYWNMTRRDFPEVFALRAEQSRELGVKLTRVKGTRVFLDQLPEDYLPAEPLEDISCGPDCGPQEMPAAWADSA